jgi:hypothetical protein
MLETQRLAGLLRVLLALAFLALFVAQVRVLPAMYDDWVRDAAEPVPSAWLLTTAVLVLLCVQVVVVCTWRLLTLVSHDRLFRDDSVVWVDTILAALAAAWLLLAGASCYLLVLGSAPGLSGAVLLALVADAVLGLLLVVMRALLRQATTLRVELEAVV